MKIMVFTVITLLALSVSPGLDAEAGELKPFMRGSFAAIAKTHARPFILSFWSVDCAPCLAEMATLRRLRVNHPEFAVVLVAADRQEDESRVRRVLEQRGPDGAETWLFGETFVERLRADVDPMWQGELPRSHLFGTDGSVRLVEGMIEEPQLAGWIEKQNRGR